MGNEDVETRGWDTDAHACQEHWLISGQFLEPDETQCSAMQGVNEAPDSVIDRRGMFAGPSK